MAKKKTAAAAAVETEIETEPDQAALFVPASEEELAVAIYNGVRLPGSSPFPALELRDKERYRTTAATVRKMLIE